MFNNKRKDNAELDKINVIIREITKGSLGTVLKKERWELYNTGDVDELYSFENERLKLNYHANGFNSHRDTYHQTFIVYYNDVLVYSNTDGEVKCLKKQTSWVNELYRVYNNHLEIQKDQQLKFQQHQALEQKIAKVRKIFGLVDSAGYMDSKIAIDRIEARVILAPDWSNSNDEIVLKGRIRLLDGTVVYDTRNSILHPGHWIDYVCNLVDLFELQRRQEQLLRSSQYNYEQQQKRLARQREYDNNHTPIDDSKYFR